MFHATDFEDLIFAMLQKKPEKRLRLERCLTHPWFEDAETELNLSDELVLPDQQTSEVDIEWALFFCYKGINRARNWTFDENHFLVSS